MLELENLGASIFIMEAIPESPLEGYESGYLAIIEGIPYYFSSEGHSVDKILKQESNPDWKPQQSVNAWRFANIEESHNQTD